MSPRVRNTSLACIGLWLCAGCGADDSGDAAFDEQAVIVGFADNVAVPIWNDFANQTLALRDGVDGFAEQRDSASLESAQAAWIAARVPWEQAGTFLFGPVADLGLDPAIDTWPLDSDELQSVLDSNVALDVDAVRGFRSEIRGFHTIEFLLWGQYAVKSIDDWQDDDGAWREREFEYLKATAAILAEDAATIRDAWDPDFRNHFVASGEAGGAHASRHEAAREIVNGMVVLMDEVASTKLSEPFYSGDTSLVTSPFSFNSLADFRANVLSVRYSYQGFVDDVSTSSGSLMAFTQEHDPDLHARVDAGIEKSLTAIDGIRDPFRTAIVHEGENVGVAIDEVRALILDLEELLLLVGR